MASATIQVHDPAVHPWVTVQNGDLGTIDPGGTKLCQIFVNPPDGTTAGTYFIQLDLDNNGTAVPATLTVEVTSAPGAGTEIRAEVAG